MPSLARPVGTGCLDLGTDSVRCAGRSPELGRLASSRPVSRAAVSTTAGAGAPSILARGPAGGGGPGQLPHRPGRRGQDHHPFGDRAAPRPTPNLRSVRVQLPPAQGRARRRAARAGSPTRRPRCGPERVTILGRVATARTHYLTGVATNLFNPKASSSSASSRCSCLPALRSGPRLRCSGRSSSWRACCGWPPWC